MKLLGFKFGAFWYQTYLNWWQKYCQEYMKAYNMCDYSTKNREIFSNLDFLVPKLVTSLNFLEGKEKKLVSNFGNKKVSLFC